MENGNIDLSEGRVLASEWPLGTLLFYSLIGVCGVLGFIGVCSSGPRTGK